MKHVDSQCEHRDSKPSSGKLCKSKHVSGARLKVTIRGVERC